MPKITYLGHSCMLLEGTKASIVIDPFLSGNPKSPITPKEVKVEYVLITHGHGDHLGDGIEIAIANKATIVGPYELACYCEAKGAKVHPMHIGGSFHFPFGQVKLTIAHHGSAIVEEGQTTYLGNPCGFLVTLDDKTIYHAGDTGLFYDMKLIGEMNSIDCAMLPIGGNFTMDIEDAVKATELLNPGLVIPMHYDTFEVIQADPQQFIKKVQALGKKGQILNIGESLTV